MSGKLPDTLTRLTNLKKLWLAENNFRGPLPVDVLEALTSLKVILHVAPCHTMLKLLPPNMDDVLGVSCIRLQQEKTKAVRSRLGTSMRVL